MKVTVIIPDGIIAVSDDVVKTKIPDSIISILNRKDSKGFAPIALQWGGSVSEIEYEKPGTLERLNIQLVESDFDKYVAPFVSLWEKSKEEAQPQQMTTGILGEIANLEMSGLRAVQELLSTTTTEEERKSAQAKLDEIVLQKAELRKQL